MKNDYICLFFMKIKIIFYLLIEVYKYLKIKPSTCINWLSFSRDGQFTSSTHMDTHIYMRVHTYTHAGVCVSSVRACASELLTKQAMRKKNYYIQKIHAYLSYLRHLLYWVIRFRMPVSKRSATCELCHILYCKTLKKTV
jgi:hypothetical protein